MCADGGFEPEAVSLTVNRWIVGETAVAAAEAEEAIAAYRFNDAAHALYRFTWNTFCDWYIEFTKPILDSGTEAEKAETRATMAWTLDTLLHLLHPIMPFVTEELWEALAPDDAPRRHLLIDGRWPDLPASLVRSDAKAEMDWVVRSVSTIRAVRAEINVPPRAKLGLIVRGANIETGKRLERHGGLIRRLARLDGITDAEDAPLPEGAVQAVVDEAVFALPVGEVIDIAQEKSRLEKEFQKLAGEIGKIDAKLGNANFVARAPEEVVEEQRERLVELHRSRDRLAEAIDRLAAA